MTKARRVWSALAAMALFSGVYLYLFGWGTVYAIMARWMARNAPVVKLVPVPAPDSMVDNQPLHAQTALGYEFQIPMDDLDESQTEHREHSVVLKSRSYRWAIAVLAGGPKELVKEMTSQNERAAVAMYGDGLRSDFALRERIYNMTPSQVTPFTPYRVATSEYMILIEKGVMLPSEAESGFYELRAGRMTGYQFGNPSVSKKVNLELFDDDGGVSFLIHQQAEGGKMPITQAEINRIVQSVRRVGTADAVR